MKGHLNDADVAEVLFGAGTPEVRAHAAGCEACGRRLAEAAETLHALREVEVPEPEPPYWDDFRRNVRVRIAEQQGEAGWRVRWLAPAVALAGTLVLVVAFPHRAPEPGQQSIPVPAVQAWAPLPPADEDDGLAVLEGYVASTGDLNWEEGRGLGSFVDGLSDEESDALASALRNGAKGGVL